MNYNYIDLTYVNEIAEGNNELIKELITIFKSQVDEYITEFNQHLEDKNWQSLGALAHKAKSSAAVMGLKTLADDLKRLEIMAKEGNETHLYPEIVKDYESITKNAIIELDEHASKLD